MTKIKKIFDDILFLGKRLDVWENVHGAIFISYENCEVKTGPILQSVKGAGRTIQEAREDYIRKICGKTLVFNAYTDRREEIRV